MKNVILFFIAVVFASATLTSCGNGNSKEVANDKSAVSDSTPAIEERTDSGSDCDKFVKDYEAFVDNYIVILKKYKKNPADASILKEYSTMAQQATEMQTNAAKCTDPKYSSKLVDIASKMATAVTEIQ